MSGIKLNFTRRIALFNAIASAIITFIAFVIIYWVVYSTSYRHLDEDILVEKEEVMNSLDFSGDSIILRKMPEWEEAEHREVEVNPVFLQITSIKGGIIFTSGNLGNKKLHILTQTIQPLITNLLLSNRRIRQGQFPLISKKGQTVGWLTIAISQEESFNVLRNLMLILCSFFPVILIFQYLIMLKAASKAISPVHKIINTAANINESNFGTKLPLPPNKDELYKLAVTINDLLDRIDGSIRQQKQFIDDASHEMRTPLSAIRGILEVLVRKKRTVEQYEKKIEEVIVQTDRLSLLYDQLLQLSRLEAGTVYPKKERTDLYIALLQIKEKWSKRLQKENIAFNLIFSKSVTVDTDSLFIEIIFDNLISNSLKYAGRNSSITVQWLDELWALSFSDNGPGVSPEQLPYLFERFYRTDESRSSSIQGNGLGLAIVKKLAELQSIKVEARQTAGEGLGILFFFK